MKLEEVLNLMDHEVWVRVRPHKRGPVDEAILPDIVIWSADWIGGGGISPYTPEELKDYLDWGADDLSVEMHDDPELQGALGPQHEVPMIVVNAYQYGAEEPA